MRPGFVAADVEGGSKGLSAIEAPRSAVVGRIGGDKIGYWRFRLVEIVQKLDSERT